mmetsp:Transcript_7074/g.25187  ORF Transcript_7074/g.25187 Transcript_7074/m.25187 type:complete len:293 (+) Transcript_7074:1332-2210(+)
MRRLVSRCQKRGPTIVCDICRLMPKSGYSSDGRLRMKASNVRIGTSPCLLSRLATSLMSGLMRCVSLKSTVYWVSLGMTWRRFAAMRSGTRESSGTTCASAALPYSSACDCADSIVPLTCPGFSPLISSRMRRTMGTGTITFSFSMATQCRAFSMLVKSHSVTLFGSRSRRSRGDLAMKHVAYIAYRNPTRSSRDNVQTAHERMTNERKSRNLVLQLLARVYTMSLSKRVKNLDLSMSHSAMTLDAGSRPSAVRMPRCVYALYNRFTSFNDSSRHTKVRWYRWRSCKMRKSR